LHEEPFQGRRGIQSQAPPEELRPYHFIDSTPLSVTHITFRHVWLQFSKTVSDLYHLKRQFRRVSRAPVELGVELWLCSVRVPCSGPVSTKPFRVG
jgi:hypothetical protein